MSARKKKPAPKKPTTKKRRVGRPQFKLPRAKFEQMCRDQSTREEIAAALGICEKTLVTVCHRTYGADFYTVFQQKRIPGLISLRRWQFANAQQGNTTMQIWLGKQYLGQKDKIEHSTTRDEALAKLAALMSDRGWTADEIAATLAKSE